MFKEIMQNGPRAVLARNKRCPPTRVHILQGLDMRQLSRVSAGVEHKGRAVDENCSMEMGELGANLASSS